MSQTSLKAKQKRLKLRIEYLENRIEEVSNHKTETTFKAGIMKSTHIEELKHSLFGVKQEYRAVSRRLESML